MTVGMTVDATELRFMSDRLAAVPEDVRAGMRPALRAAGQRVRATAASNASWSSRIPAALQVRVRLNGPRMGVYVLASRAAAPHARPLEGIVSDPFRHPVFGMDVWVAQRARPYLFPAARDHRADIESAVNAAVTDALRRTAAS